VCNWDSVYVIVVSCPNRFFLCFGWGKGSGVTPITISFWIPRFWGLFEGQQTSHGQDVYMLQSPTFAVTSSEQILSWIQGWRKQPGDGLAKLSTIPRITGTQASRGVGGIPPENFWKLDAQICYFWHIFTISMKDILYITLKVQAVSIQNDLTWKTKKKEIFFFN